MLRGENSKYILLVLLTLLVSLATILFVFFVERSRDEPEVRYDNISEVKNVSYKPPADFVNSLRSMGVVDGVNVKNVELSVVTSVNDGYLQATQITPEGRLVYNAGYKLLPEGVLVVELALGAYVIEEQKGKEAQWLNSAVNRIFEIIATANTKGRDVSGHEFELFFQK